MTNGGWIAHAAPQGRTMTLTLSIALILLLIGTTLLPLVAGAGSRAGPDVTVSAINMPAAAGSYALGSAVNLNATVENVGDLSALSTVFSFWYLNQTSGTPVQITSFNVGTLAAGANDTRQFAWNTSGVADLQRGNLTLRFKGNATVDVNNTNDTMSRIITLTSANISIDSVTPEVTMAVVGDWINVTAVLNNTGNMNATGELVRFFVDNAPMDAWNTTVNVTMGMTTAVVFPWNTSGLSVGQHNVTVWAAGQQMTTADVNLTAPPAAVIIVTAVEPAVLMAEAGTIIPVNTTVNNTGNLNATGVLVEFFVDNATTVAWNTSLNISMGGSNSTIYPWNTSGLPAGPHNVTAKSWGSWLTSPNVTITVTPPPPPGAKYGIHFESPGNNSLVNSSSVEVTLNATGGFQLMPMTGNMSNMDGMGHWGLEVDGTEVQMGAALTTWVTGLQVGNHSIHVMLHNMDHTPINGSRDDTLMVVVPADAPGIFIDRPSAGDSPINSSSTKVQVHTRNFNLTAPNASSPNMTGVGHYHLWLDGVRIAHLGVAEYDLTRLGAGTHELRVELANINHTGLTTRVLDSASFTISTDRPGIAITAPLDGATIQATKATANVTVNITAENFELNGSQIGKNDSAGQGHWHLFVDGTLATFGNSTSLDAALAPGKHVLRAELRGNNHTVLMPPVWDGVTVTVLPAPAPTKGTIHVVVKAADTGLPLEAHLSTDPPTAPVDTVAGLADLIVPPGSYTVTATPVSPAYNASTSGVTTVVAGGIQEVDINLPKKAPVSTTVKLDFLAIVNGNGNPVRDAKVTIECGVYKDTQTTGGNGKATFPAFPKDCLGKDFTITVTHESYKKFTNTKVRCDSNLVCKLGSADVITLESSSPDPALVVTILIVALIVIAGVLGVRRSTAEEKMEEEEEEPEGMVPGEDEEDDEEEDADAAGEEHDEEEGAADDADDEESVGGEDE